MGKITVQKTSLTCVFLGFLLCFGVFFLIKKIELVLCRRLLKLRKKLYVCFISRQKCFLFLSINTSEKLQWKSI